VEPVQVVDVCEKKFDFSKLIIIEFAYRVITLVAKLDGSGGGFSRIISGGGVFGGVGRSKYTSMKNESIRNERGFLYV
jgi:hypothetical protein